MCIRDRYQRRVHGDKHFLPEIINQKKMETEKQQQQKAKTTQKAAPRRVGAPVRLWVKGRFLGYKRSKVNQYERHALIKIQGLNDKEGSWYYLGKRVAYIFKASTLKNGTRFRVQWGRVTKAHGNNGVVIARFKRAIPPQAMGGQVRIMLYPNRFQQDYNKLAQH
eukprot:TRINITY_DN29_c0_g1_i5.p1 TRINITY_DN29_c0_g1~~TRINITY_DN29_c0_g1_i5.p1  ORF type:complete len:165 (+),score=49.52 TRINITY_DN29_c0_g1_i5:69-563(+)